MERDEPEKVENLGDNALVNQSPAVSAFHSVVVNGSELPS